MGPSVGGVFSPLAAPRVPTQARGALLAEREELATGRNRERRCRVIHQGRPALPRSRRQWVCSRLRYAAESMATGEEMASFSPQPDAGRRAAGLDGRLPPSLKKPPPSPSSRAESTWRKAHRQLCPGTPLSPPPLYPLFSPLSFFYFLASASHCAPAALQLLFCPVFLTFLSIVNAAAFCNLRVVVCPLCCLRLFVPLSYSCCVAISFSLSDVAFTPSSPTPSGPTHPFLFFSFFLPAGRLAKCCLWCVKNNAETSGGVL